MIKALILIAFYLYSAFIYSMFITDIIAESGLILGSGVNGFVLMMFFILCICFLIPMFLVLGILLIVLIFKSIKREIKIKDFKNYFIEFFNNKFLAVLRIINFVFILWQTIALKLWNAPVMMFLIIREFITNIQ